MNSIRRWTDKLLQSTLKTHRVACVIGCRQTGKTTLVKQNISTPTIYQTLDSDATRAAAEQDPTFFVRRPHETCLVIDEIQKVPSLIGEIKIAVDNNPSKGQYIIMGSADYRKLPYAKESLAGRVGFVRVRTFTEGELRGIKNLFLDSLFRGQIPYSCQYDECNKPLIVKLALAGGFHEAQTLDVDGRAQWFEFYLQQIILDMRDQWGVRKLNRIREMFIHVASFSSRPFVVRRLSQQLNAAWQTVNTYFFAIEAMYLVDTVPAWAFKDYDRPGLTPKLFMTDSGLMGHLLGIYDAEKLVNDLELSANEGGKLVETWAYNQLIPEVELHPRWELHHLRTKSHEIDFLITNEDNKMLAIDIKSGESVSNTDFRHIRWFQEMFGDDSCTGIVLYAGNEVRSFGNRCYAIPLAAMWNYQPRLDSVQLQMES